MLQHLHKRVYKHFQRGRYPTPTLTFPLLSVIFSRSKLTGLMSSPISNSHFPALPSPDFFFHFLTEMKHVAIIKQKGLLCGTTTDIHHNSFFSWSQNKMFIHELITIHQVHQYTFCQRKKTKLCFAALCMRLNVQ